MKENRENKKKLSELVADAIIKAENQRGYWMNYAGTAYAAAAAASSEKARPMTLVMKMLQSEDTKEAEETVKQVESTLGSFDEKTFAEAVSADVKLLDKNLVPVKEVQEGADYNDIKNVIEIPPLADYDRAEQFAHDLYMASTLATGSSHGFNRPGNEINLQEYSQGDILREQLVAELSTGILMAEKGRPALLAPDSVQLAEKWSSQLREDPEFAKSVFWDVNRAVTAVRQALQGQKVDYASILQTEQKPSPELAKKDETKAQSQPVAAPKSMSEQKAAERQVELITSALSQSKEKGGVWMNEAGHHFPAFYPKGPSVSPFNAINLTLHTDQGGYRTNHFTTFSDARQRGESVMSGQKGVPFLWYNWNKYVNHNNPDDTISRKQYLELPKEERQQYKGIHDREVRIVFNVDQTMTPHVDADGYKTLSERPESDERALKESVSAFIENISSNLVSIQKGSGLIQATYDVKNDFVLMPDVETYAQYPDYVHDLIAETVRATGYGDRLAREGVRITADQDARVKEELIVELATGVKMVELGLPARLSPKAQGMVDEWNRQLREDPKMIDAVEADVNNAVEVINKAEQGAKIEYSSMVNRKKTEELQLKQKPQVSASESLILADIIARHGMNIHPGNFANPEEMDAFLDKFNLRYYNDEKENALSHKEDADPGIADTAYSLALIQAASIDELAREYRPSEWNQKGRHEIEASIRELLDRDSKAFVIVEDPVNRRSDVILREGAFSGGKVVSPNGTERNFSITPDEVMSQSERKELGAKVQFSDASGFSKARIEKAMEHQGLESNYVRFFNTTGVLGYHPDDRYFQDKKLYVANLNQWKLENVRPIDVSEAVERAQKPQLERVNMVKDDDGRWVMYIKPTGQEPFGIHPDKEDLNRFFTIAHDGNDEQTARVRDELAVKYYELAQVKPDLKVNLLGERATEEDAARLHDVHIFKNKQGQYMLMAKVSDMPTQVPPKTISATQWQRLWLSPDQKQYKVDLAAKIFSDILHPVQEREETTKQTVSDSKPQIVAEEKPKNELSSLVKQFLDLKKKHPEALLLFRTGDFYQTYKQDAEKASNILGITLTKSSRVKDEEGKPLAMAGFPYHNLDSYLPKLIRAGQRVAICDQIEDPRQQTVEQDSDSEQVETEETQSRHFHR